MRESIDARTLRRVSDLHAVYRMFDAQGHLLYVGMTGDAGNRLGGHVMKRWFPLVADIRLEWFPTKAAAQVAEKRAIDSERPRLNRAPGCAPETLVPVPSPAVLLKAVLPPEPPVPTTVTLSQACQMRILSCTIAAARKASQRPGFPDHTGRDGLAKTWNASDLHGWQAGKAKVTR